MKIASRLIAAGGLALLGIACAAPALAQSFPSKPITIITAFGPGSASDTITRVVGQPLGAALKQSVIVEAKPGASGALSALYVARAPADGYTLLMTTNSPHSAVPYLMKNVSYDPIKDFSFVSRLGSFTLMLCVHPERAGEVGQGADRLRQEQPGQADLRQRQQRRHRRRRHGQALGARPTCCTCPTRARRRPSPTCWPAGCR